MSDFTKFNLNEPALKFIAINGFSTPTTIQQVVIPLALKRRNIIGISKTGSGKSHAFLIPIIEKIDVSRNELQVVISAPTRELAIQLCQKARVMTEVLPELKIVEATGGSDRLKLIERVKNNCHILIGTPGRLKDVVEQQAIRVDKVKTLIIDEADMTFESGFLETIDAVAGKMPKELNIMVFGATIPQQLQAFIAKYLTDAVTVDLSQNEEPGEIENILVACKHRSYQEQLLQILPGINPYVCLIFANSRKEAAATAELLRSHNYQINELHGDMSARARRQALKKIQNHNDSYIVATDLAARGLDIDSISHVISLGLPSDLDFFIHRSGRTGRNGRKGWCYTLYRDSDAGAINQLKKRGIKFVYQNYSKGQWRITKTRKPQTKKMDEFEREIVKIVSRKNQKVKPGYKKKMQAEIQDIKRKKRRAMIQASIKQVSKEKNKQKQREKQEA